MHLFLKKILLFFLFISHLQLFASIEVTSGASKSKNTRAKQKSSAPYHPITPSAGPRVKRGLDLFLIGKFLYWTGRLDTLTYARRGPIISLSDLPEKANIHSVNWQWDPGFQVGLGWNFCHGDWDMQLKYTWFYTKASNETKGTVHPSFPPILFNQITATGARAKWDLHYQLGDLEWGRNFLVHRYLKLRPFIGIKGGWQKQNYVTRYFETTIELTTPAIELTTPTIRTHFDHALWGLGPRSGLNSSWQFANWASLYGDLALSGLWLHYTTERTDRFIGEEITLTPPRIKKTLRMTKPMIELGLGLRLETYFSCRRLHILFQVGWETHIWPNQTFYIDFNEGLKRFDLLLHGGTAKLRFDF